jgi:hypothetical protein
MGNATLSGTGANRLNARTLPKPESQYIPGRGFVPVINPRSDIPSASELFQKANQDSYGNTLGGVVSDPANATTMDKFNYTPGTSGVPNFAGGMAPELRSAEMLAKLYGVNIDQAGITDAFKGSVDSAYKGANRDYTRNLADTQMTYLDAMRKSNAGGVQSGAAKGIQGAQELSAMLGMSQQSSAGASKLATDQSAASAKAVQDAMAYADQNKLALGGMSGDLYGKDITREGNKDSVAAQYADMASRERMANADRLSREKISESDRTAAAKLSADQLNAASKVGSPEVAAWREFFGLGPNDKFSNEQIMIVKGIAPADGPGYGLNSATTPDTRGGG